MTIYGKVRGATLALILGGALALNGCGGGGGTSDTYATSNSYSASMLEDTAIYIDLETGAVSEGATATGDVVLPDSGVAGASPSVAGAIDSSLPYYVVTPPANGTVYLEGKLLKYVPDANWYGTDNVGLEQGTEADLDYRRISIVINVTDVAEENFPPKISGAPSTNVGINAPYSFIPTATDSNNDPLTFAISNKPDWATFNTATGELSGTAPSFDSVYNAIGISVSDGQERVYLEPFSITVESNNHAPTISGVPTTVSGTGEPYSFTPFANDVDGDTLTFAISNKPYWATFDTATGELGGTTPETEGQYLGIGIYVTDGIVTASLEPFDIIVEGTNHAPTIDGQPTTTINMNEPYSFTPFANDVDGDTLSFAISNKPDWATFNTATGELSGTAPSFEDIYADIVISVTDGLVLSELSPFDITVTTINHPPKIEGVPATQVVEGQTYDFTPIASDPDGDVLTFHISTIPTWATFDTTTGRLTGVADGTVSSYKDIVIYVDDGENVSYLDAFDLEIITPAP